MIVEAQTDFPKSCDQEETAVPDSNPSNGGVGSSQHSSVSEITSPEAQGEREPGAQIGDIILSAENSVALACLQLPLPFLNTS